MVATREDAEEGYSQSHIVIAERLTCDKPGGFLLLRGFCKAATLREGRDCALLLLGVLLFFWEMLLLR